MYIMKVRQPLIWYRNSNCVMCSRCTANEVDPFYITTGERLPILWRGDGKEKPCLSQKLQCWTMSSMQICSSPLFLPIIHDNPLLLFFTVWGDNIHFCSTVRLSCIFSSICPLPATVACTVLCMMIVSVRSEDNPIPHTDSWIHLRVEIMSH